VQEKCQPQQQLISKGVWMFVFTPSWGKIEAMKSPEESRKARVNKLEQPISSVEEFDSKQLLERDFGLWLEALRDVFGGKNSGLANAICKDWPDSDYSRRKIGLPGSEAFLQLVRTWFQERRTLPNNRLKDERYSRLGVLDTLQNLIDSNLGKAPAGTSTGLTFSEIVNRLREGRERNSNRSKESESVDYELLALGVVSIHPVKISKVREQDLLLGSSEYDGDVPPYCSRDSDSEILEKINIDSYNPVILVGPPKSGKTRTLIQNLKLSKFADAKVYWLEPGFRNANSLLERTKTSGITNVLVLDDLQNPRYFGEGGLDSRLIDELASNFKIVGTIHDYTKSQWERANVDHRIYTSDQTTTSPNSSVQMMLLENHISIASELSDFELNKASQTLGFHRGELSSYRYLGSKLASVTALEKILDYELSGTNSFSHALFQSLIDAKVLFPQGAGIDDLKSICKRNLENASNTPWTESGWENSVDIFTRGLSPKSPHAIMMRTISDRSKFTLFDPIWDRKRPASWNPQNLLGMDLDYVVVAENAFEMGYQKAAFQILMSLDTSLPETQFQVGRFHYKAENPEGSLEWLLRAAEANHDRALDYLGDLYEEQFNNSEKAVEYWLRSAELGNTWAMDSLGDYYRDADQLVEAEKWWTKASIQENQWSMASLGLLKKRSGLDEEGENLLLRAADLGNAWAMRQLGIFRENAQDGAGAESWWMKAAEKGDDWAIFKLGLLAMERENFSESSYWFEKGIALEQALSYRGMGILRERQDSLIDAEKFWTKASELSDSVAMDYLGDLYEDQGNLNEAEKWWAKGATEGNSDSMYSLGWLASDREDKVLAEDWWTKSAKLLHPGSMFMLGELEANEGNQEKAHEWWEMAAELDNDRAIFRLGRLKTLEQEFEKAELWFQKGISLDHTLSIRGMGLLKFEIEDYVAARDWLTRASKLGDDISMDYLGDLSELQNNLSDAKIWWEKAASEGNTFSMYSLGWLAFDSDDRKLARDWWVKASELKHAGSMDALGDLAKESDDLREAEHWWISAALLGDEDSMISLAHLYKDNKDFEESLKWLEICAEKQNVHAITLIIDLYSELHNPELSQFWTERLESLREND